MISFPYLQVHIRLLAAEYVLLSCGMAETDKYAVTFQVALFYTQVEFNINQQLASL